MSKRDEGKTGLSGIRKSLGLTQEDIAKALHVSTRTVINWENGHHEPRLTIRQVKALCLLLRLPIESIPDDFTDLERTNADHDSDMTSAD